MTKQHSYEGLREAIDALGLPEDLRQVAQLLLDKADPYSDYPPGAAVNALIRVSTILLMHRDERIKDILSDERLQE